MPHNVLIALHTTAAVLAFATGVGSLRLSTAQSWWYRTYVGSMGAMWAFLFAVIAVDWLGLDTATRWLYAGLLGLGLYMVWRSAHAGLRLHAHGDGWRPRYLEDIGFTLIALFDGFVIITAIDLGAPAWLVIAMAVAGIAAGNLAMHRVKARLGTQPAAE
jgi:hypothetical protein